MRVGRGYLAGKQKPDEQMKETGRREGNRKKERHFKPMSEQERKREIKRKE